MIQDGEDADLNEGSGTKTSKSYSKDGYNRYYINIGSIDGVTEADLLHFLSDVTGIDRKSFGDLSLQKNCAFFNVIKTSDKDISSKFKGIEVEGRSIRVNLDDQGNKGPKARPSKKRNKSRQNPPSHFNRSGNSRRDFRRSRSKRH
jgi:ATP-dependent RNA helicase DeaD